MPRLMTADQRERLTTVRSRMLVEEEARRRLAQPLVTSFAGLKAVDALVEAGLTSDEGVRSDFGANSVSGSVASDAQCSTGLWAWTRSAPKLQRRRCSSTLIRGATSSRGINPARARPDDSGGL